MSITKWILLGYDTNLALCEDHMDLAVIGSSIVHVVLLHGLSGDQ